ncbi:hypothetical protein PAHAL_2G069500 [Panicum hallii]|uniref:Uncharacterized protein n=1 Tax=Panicum hallii TaxID=206008 RepID=A0A2S3GWF1_9POAL|nr:hypothetical protein PAHAL_2G069500 [Panicum hallii]
MECCDVAFGFRTLAALHSLKCQKSEPCAAAVGWCHHCCSYEFRALWNSESPSPAVLPLPWHAFQVKKHYDSATYMEYCLATIVGIYIRSTFVSMISALPLPQHHNCMVTIHGIGMIACCK